MHNLRHNEIEFLSGFVGNNNFFHLVLSEITAGNEYMQNWLISPAHNCLNHYYNNGEDKWYISFPFEDKIREGERKFAIILTAGRLKDCAFATSFISSECKNEVMSYFFFKEILQFFNEKKIKLEDFNPFKIVEDSQGQESKLLYINIGRNCDNFTYCEKLLTE
jgi:hypothetical protein